jgi:predicted extracellular nuclease
VRSTSPRIAALAVSVLVAGGVVALGSPPAPASSADVAISQVYGGGGNSGATLTADFIELRNTSAAAVDLTGWSVQHASSTGPTCSSSRDGIATGSRRPRRTVER